MCARSRYASTDPGQDVLRPPWYLVWAPTQLDGTVACMRSRARTSYRGDGMRANSIEDYLRPVRALMREHHRILVGYATPHCAANILKDAHHRQRNSSEWISACYRADPLRRPRPIQSRHAPREYVLNYQRALTLVRRVNQHRDGRSSPAGSESRGRHRG